jgi:hypothetical protein
MSYKRNQIEEAIARIFDPNCKNPPSELRTRIKRLLELDRSIGRKRQAQNVEDANFAFFSATSKARQVVEIITMSHDTPPEASGLWPREEAALWQIQVQREYDKRPTGRLICDE